MLYICYIYGDIDDLKYNITCRTSVFNEPRPGALKRLPRSQISRPTI